MVSSVGQLFGNLQAGARLLNGDDLATMIRLTLSAQTGITALAGGSITNATPLNAYVNEVTTVATANDSVLLPPAVPGLEVTVINSAGVANAVKVYAYPNNPNNVIAGVPQNDSITPLASNSPAQSNTVSQFGICVYTCVSLGRWKASI